MPEDFTTDKLWQRVREYQWNSLSLPHLVYEDISPIITSLSGRKRITHSRIGKSFMGTPVHQLRIGNGPLSILAWTQMHGDEPTATAAALDLLAMLSDPACDNLLGEDWASRLTLHVIPMLNPDGASQRTRENAQGVDINRDARALQTPEGRILDAQVTRLAPTVGFNLHDQSRYYAVGSSQKPATLSFLAPPFNTAGDVNESRLLAKQLIAAMYDAVSDYRDGQFGRYDDTYAHRCFGDTIAAKGVSTILIESGADYDDPNRQTARTLNVIAMLSACRALLTGNHQEYSVQRYYQIAENRESGMCDLLLTQITQVSEDGVMFQCDVAINKAPKDFTKGLIQETGDLSDTGAFEKRDCHGFTLTTPSAFKISQPLTLTDDVYRQHIGAGFTHYLDSDGLLTLETTLPVRVMKREPAQQMPLLQPGMAVCLPLVRDDGSRVLISGTHWIDGHAPPSRLVET